MTDGKALEGGAEKSQREGPKCGCSRHVRGKQQQRRSKAEKVKLEGHRRLCAWNLGSRGTFLSCMTDGKALEGGAEESQREGPKFGRSLHVRYKAERRRERSKSRRRHRCDGGPPPDFEPDSGRIRRTKPRDSGILSRKGRVKS